MSDNVHPYTLPIAKLTDEQCYGLPITGNGEGTRHKHGAAFHQISWVDPETGISYTGVANIQAQTMDEARAAKDMPKGKDGKKQTFKAKDFVAARRKAVAAE